MTPQLDSLVASLLRAIRGEHGALPTDGEWPWVQEALARTLRASGDTPLQTPRSDIGWLALRYTLLAAAAGTDLERLRAISELEGRSSVADAVRELARSWIDVLSGRSVESPAHTAQDAFDPSIPIERMCLAALSHLNQGDVPEAVKGARRASRMAASEGVLHAEYLANLVLARARRHAGHPHLAQRILRQLAPLVTPMWTHWLETELVLAGGATTIDPPSCPMLRSEFAALHAMMGGEPVPVEAQAWCRGEENMSPFGMRGGAVHPTFSAALVVRPGEKTRRVLFASLDPALTVVAAAPSAARTRSALRALALRPQLTPEELFQAAYGFPLDGRESVLRGLLHRTRKSLDAIGDITRYDDLLSLAATEPFVVPDPECDWSLDERLLTYLSMHSGSKTARDAARVLQVPHRTVQRALSQLVEDGVCERVPDGRSVLYAVEDTTFANPTVERMRWPSEETTNRG